MKQLLIILATLSFLTGCDNKPEVKADAECYFSTTKTTATHFTNGSASDFETDFDGKKMSGWGWVQRVTNAVSDATCHEIKK